MLTKDFTKWVLVANIIAWPVAWYAVSEWLQSFAYRVEMSWWIFVLAGGIALIIALLTISLQAIKAATANPVESLRYE
jgi:putative ABC transport system permease protein